MMSQSVEQAQQYHGTPIVSDVILSPHDDLDDAGRIAAKEVVVRDRLDSRGRINHFGTHSEDFVNGQEPVQDEIIVDVTNAMNKLLVDIEQGGRGFDMERGEFIITDADGKPVCEPRVFIKFAVTSEE
jgi:hypothetical protein